MRKEIGKIQDIRLGVGGYQDAMLGLTVVLGSDRQCWSVTDFKGFWGPSIQWSDDLKWTEADRRAAYADVLYFISALLADAKKDHLEKLNGVPVEVCFNSDGKLKSWRILTEVL